MPGVSTSTSLRVHYERVLAAAGWQGGRLLDVGCGAGRFLRLAAERYAGLTAGIDPRRSALADAGNLLVTQGDGLRLPFPCAAFDLVTTMETLEWAADPAALLRESARVCAPTGLVVSDDSDWDTVVFSVSDEALGRRVLRAFCDSGPAGWIGRRAPGLARQAGLGLVRCEVDVVLERSYQPGCYGHEQARVIADWLRVKGEVSPDEIDRWLADLERQAARGDYLFSVNRYVVIARPEGLGRAQNSGRR